MVVAPKTSYFPHLMQETVCSRTSSVGIPTVPDAKKFEKSTIYYLTIWGEYDRANVLKMIRVYECPEPYVATEMEDIAVCAAAGRMGLLDRVIVLRDSVNMDVFMLGNTPEKLWNPLYEWEEDLASNEIEEVSDIFPTAMKNNFTVGSAVIDAILAGNF